MSPDAGSRFDHRRRPRADASPISTRCFYPETGFTKGEMLDYYARIAPVMLPHLRDRPVTMKRFPDGVDGQSFFEKHVPRHAPEWIDTVSVPLEAEDDGPIDYRASSRPGRA